MDWAIGSDTGGTFTDLVALSDANELRIAKVPSTYPHLETGLIEGIGALDVNMADVRILFHATTVATNAAITRSGAKTGLITTAGFRDVLELRRVDRKDLYDVLWDPPSPLVPRRDRLEVSARVDHLGREMAPLHEAEVAQIAALFRRRGIEAVAVVLINAFANPSHEQRIRAILARELPSAVVSISSDVLPEPPEFERTATTVANAYLAPPLSGYMSRLKTAVKTEGYAGDVVLVMHNAGGTMTSDYASGVPIRTLNSGPAGGAIAGAWIARHVGRRNVVCLDMGGTSADVSLILEGDALLSNSSELEWGLPIRFPAIDVVSVGAGGGSIAWIDAAGVLKVGPQSAGAYPGPASYQRGGTEATVTDAHLVLGTLGESVPLGGEVRLSLEKAKTAIAQRVGRQLRLPLEDAAEAILRIANSNMALPLRLVTVERGYDPREFSLVVFGGAGPLHGVELARELGIPEVIIPAHPGVTSALGVLNVPLVDDFSAAVNTRLDDVVIDQIRKTYSELEARVSANLLAHGAEKDHLVVDRSLDIRYVGQLHSLIVPLREVSIEGLQDARALFDEAHERQYRYSHPEWGVEIATVRVSARGRKLVEGVGYSRQSQTTGVSRYQRPVRFLGEGRRISCPIVDRARIEPGDRVEGPLILEQKDSTVSLPPGTVAECSVTGELIARV